MKCVNPRLFLGDFGDRYFGTDGWSEDDQEELTCRHKSYLQKAEDSPVVISGL